MEQVAKREALIIALIAVAVFILLFFIIVLVKDNPKAGLPQSERSEMDLDINYWFLYEGYVSPVFVVSNLSKEQWNKCKMVVDERFEMNIGTLLVEKEKVLAIGDFKNSAGARFDHSLGNPSSACITCNEPNYDMICGTFSLK